MEKQIVDFNEINIRRMIVKHLNCSIFDVTVHKIFEIKRYNVHTKKQEVVYLVRYYKDGKQREITVDNLDIEKSKLLPTL